MVRTAGSTKSNRLPITNVKAAVPAVKRSCLQNLGESVWFALRIRMAMEARIIET
ncbi:MAG: hypothetical protein N2442_08590 [Spirochaetes bacterium]|nr:hypothetical protein [Spirochaetota bacterium]